MSVPELVLAMSSLAVVLVPTKSSTASLKCSRAVVAPILKLSTVAVGRVASLATVVEQPAVAFPAVSRTVAEADRTSPTAKAVPWTMVAAVAAAVEPTTSVRFG